MKPWHNHINIWDKSQLSVEKITIKSIDESVTPEQRRESSAL